MNPSSLPSIPTLQHATEEDALRAWFLTANQHRKALALWRLPGETNKHLIIDMGEGPIKGKLDLEESPAGFLLAPYHNRDRADDLFIHAHIHFTTHNMGVAVQKEHHAESLALVDAMHRQLESPEEGPYLFLNKKDRNSTSREKYIAMVENALVSIHSGRFQKVVPSAIRSIPLHPTFDGLKVFDRLCESYPNAFISLVSAPGVGSWMGASPEPLIEVTKDKKFSTAALAGTQPFVSGTPLQEVAWRQKEIEEQALVSRYIINCFKKIRLREFEEAGPKTVVAGNLLHLKTTYTVDMEATSFPQLGSVMLDLLHPTSAVCGMPKGTSMNFLDKYESFDREFYSGYLGPVNVDDETHLFVNLRCMQISEGHARLYGGAGVTEDSHPEKEWVETQLKCDTLMEVLKQ